MLADFHQTNQQQIKSTICHKSFTISLASDTQRLQKFAYFCSIMAEKEIKKKIYEKRTSLKVAILNFFVIISCCAMLSYIYGLRNSIKNQRVNIDTKNSSLSLVNKLTQTVHEAQSAANLFTFSDNPKYLDQFRQLTDSIKTICDSLISSTTNEEDAQRLAQIQNLIQRKGQISYVLSRQFYYFDPLAEINSVINEYTPPEPPKPIYITTITRDTIIHKPKEKKGFWQRIGNAIHPEEEDSIVQITTRRIDTLPSQSNIDTISLQLIDDIRTLSLKAREEYLAKVKEYEVKTNELIRDGNLLSEQISTLLQTLNQDILRSTIKEIENSEAVIERNTRISLIVGAVVMVLIIVFFFLIINDMSKSYKARKAIEEAKRKTEEIMESRHKLLLSVSHDIKTPLTSIMGNVDLMNTQGNEKEIRSIRQSAEHILNLLTNLLDFSSLEQGKLNVEKKSFNINRLSSDTASMFESIARRKALNFFYSTSVKDTLNAISDELKIKQIASNLISNSIKYTVEGEVHFKVSFENSHIVFNITDTGVGIPEDKINEIFTPFVRIDTYNTLAEGSGYGLSVVKGLVDLLGGTISVESEVGKGSHFTVKIPVEYELVERQDDVAAKAASPKNILIIDDDNTLLSVTTNMLHRLGHTATPCRSKADIEAALQDCAPFDFILTDREMGAVTGNDILRDFKDKDANKPVLLMTARSEYNQTIAQEEGFDGLLKKPFTLNDLKDLFGQATEDDKSKDETSEEVQKDKDFSADFPDFCAIMDNDSEAIENILKVFVNSAADDLTELNECIENDDCIKAQSICHKMLPMFKQLERNTGFLSKMNDLRSSKDIYPGWKDEALLFMQEADDLMEMLSEKYGIE